MSVLGNVLEAVLIMQLAGNEGAYSLGHIQTLGSTRHLAPDPHRARTTASANAEDGLPPFGGVCP